MSHHQLDYVTSLRAQGFRVTPQRQTILDAVCAGDGHTSLPEIYARVQAVSPAINLAYAEAGSFVAQAKAALDPLPDEENRAALVELADMTLVRHR